MNNIFLADSKFGTLTFKNIYEFFEEPRFFSVTNEVGGTFIVYWIGDEDEYDKWYVIPISSQRLELLERKRIDLYSSLVYQEQKIFYQTNIPYDGGCEDYIKIESDSIVGKIKLPRTGLFVSGVTPVLSTGKLGKEIEYSTHEIHVEKTATSTEPLILKGVSKLFECFNDLYSSILNSLDEKDLMRPVSGRPGSFVLSFQAEKMQQIEPLLRNLNDIIWARGDLIGFIKKNKIDVQMLTALFESVVETSSSFELKSNATDDLVLVVRKVDAEFYINGLLKLAAQVVGGYQVPQANIITQVFKIVELKWHDEQLNLISTGLDDRHILYYIHAAKILGFLNESGSVTALGQQLAESDDDKRLRIAARSFESSHCGWAWVMWSQAKNLSEVDPNTAQAFLLDKCLSLSDKTKKRRASTLKQWCEALKPAYQEL
ncbi:DUF6575 domain-containing protein [Rahnella aceris]|uniref:DUF6575 domain-containing protein n=1 Tax=Rahnella sp. (strain Y9602) TaxID=2703885 RepID=UPI001F52D24C|nr:DUF6575 domain-containing protein [Rahnella aceris]UNK55597.1 hypothetical protein MNO10_23815 [Rahnella aceris]